MNCSHRSEGTFANLARPSCVIVSGGEDASTARHPHSGHLIRRVLLDPGHLPWRIGIPPSASSYYRAPGSQSHRRPVWRGLAGRVNQRERWRPLQGWFARPADANGNAVILLHGVGDNRQGAMGFGELFLSNGFAVLVPDSRAQGESGGGFPTYGIKESDDVHRWFDWLVMQQHPKCIFGMGESMGAAIVLQSVKTTPFCAVVAESSFEVSARLH